MFTLKSIVINHQNFGFEQIVDKYVKKARILIGSHDQGEIISALNLLDSALALYPRFEDALELKARSLLYLRRYKEVADMLQEYIPSLKIDSEDSSLSSESSSQQLSKERVKLLSSDNSSERESSFKCFSVSDLKKKVMAGLCMNNEKEGHWRYLVLGQACYHLGLMEDAMVLLQTGKRLSAVSSRRESVYWSDDSFSFSSVATNSDTNTISLLTTVPLTEDVSLGQLLAHIKVLICRRTAAMAALDAGHYPEAIRHFSKILDGRRGTPQGFLAGCYIYRANAYRAAGRIAEAIADCNRALALDSTCIPALSARASLLESIRCYQECLRDLEHLKLLYNAILRDGKLPGPAWRRHNIQYRDVPGNLHRLNSKIQEFRQRIGSNESGNVDYYALIGLRRGCARSELVRAHLLLCLRHGPDKSLNFIDRCEFLDYHDLDLVKDQARMSALLLYRLLQKAYSSIMSTIMDEEAAERQRQKTAAALQAAAAAAAKITVKEQLTLPEKVNKPIVEVHNRNLKSHISNLLDPSNYSLHNIKLPEKKTSETAMAAAAASAFQGGFCRDIDIVANMLSKANFNHSIPVKYEALSC
ncbi:Tetratricopeptide repeat (TPR)-like superfamily protein [Thalictrum thalictroides]|uniref:Tetratricopeptide repeat (TPR)-like superfamily protein n=1 Tax=Thalictrum thalictroides TaxID=46969 RepID=A0A7J6XF34_THATH|nr:Tetratricopeptide repeat (TPR)-like superfamily protein [Thalictrum thalictroides]